MSEIALGWVSCVVKSIMVRETVTNVTTDKGDFFIANNHGGYSGIYPFLLASLGTKKALQGSFQLKDWPDGQNLSRVAADWIVWGG